MLDRGYASLANRSIAYGDSRIDDEPAYPDDRVVNPDHLLRISASSRHRQTSSIGRGHTSAVIIQSVGTPFEVRLLYNNDGMTFVQSKHANQADAITISLPDRTGLW